jgi:AcrR family transcriptional regulator
MKTKTEAKRLAILNAAAEVFREVGFERASMSEICARVGGSKATLYNYFPSKERLFFEVMYQANEVEFETIVGSLNLDAVDTKAELLRFGGDLLRFMYSPAAIAIRRLAIAESRNSDIGKMCYERAVEPVQKRVAEFLKKAMKRGALRVSDPRASSAQFLALLESEQLQRFLYNLPPTPKPETLAASVRRAVDAFMSGHEKRS